MSGSTSGNGDPCITHPEHGKSQVLTTRQWCGNQSHDGKTVRTRKSSKVVGRTTPWLDEQLAQQKEATA